MSAPKSRCPDCRELTFECVCDDDDVTEATAAFLKAMLGGDPEPSDGPPYVHVHRLPESEEEMAAAPEWPSLTIEKAAGRPEPQGERA